jgi:integrase/recombinase XerD
MGSLPGADLMKPKTTTPLRKRMQGDMQIRNLALRTQESYIREVALFAQYFNRSPEFLGPEEIRAYQLYLSQVKQLSPPSIAVSVAALRFLYVTTLKRTWDVSEVIPQPKRPRKLPVILSPEEVMRYLGSVTHAAARLVLATCYAGGLRITEAVILKASDIDSSRMRLRVHGKGGKEREVMLSSDLLKMLRDWYRLTKPRDWLFPGDIPGRHITTQAIREAGKEARKRSGIGKRITPHSFRHAFAVHLLEQGTDLRTLQLLLGHSNISTTAKYLLLTAQRVCATPSPLDLHSARAQVPLTSLPLS